MPSSAKSTEAGPEALALLNERLEDSGNGWHYCQADPLARRIHHVLADSLLHPESALYGVEHAAALAAQPVVIFANHLSYSDANLLEILLQRFGATPLADRLTVIAGPKVYSSMKRRFSSLCFGTIKTPQSSALSTEDAVMNAREVARAARLSIDIAHERLGLGDALLVFAEGTRSRSNGMQPLLPASRGISRDPGPGYCPWESRAPRSCSRWETTRCTRCRSGSASAGRSRLTLLHEPANSDRRLMMDIVGLAIAEPAPAGIPRRLRG